MVISKNAVGIVVLVFSLFGLEIGEDVLLEFVSSLGTVISILLMIWNQIDRTDVDSFFFKK